MWIATGGLRPRSGWRVSLYGRHLGILLFALMFVSYAPLRAADQVVLVTYGDSLSAGFGLSEPDAFPAQLEKALQADPGNLKFQELYNIASAS